MSNVVLIGIIGRQHSATERFMAAARGTRMEHMIQEATLSQR